MEITTEGPQYTRPIKYRFLMEGGHEVEIEDAEEIEKFRQILLETTEDQGGKLAYI
jgi:hypothetical protein